jgi:hypothetical protein
MTAQIIEKKEKEVKGKKCPKAVRMSKEVQWVEWPRDKPLKAWMNMLSGCAG